MKLRVRIFCEEAQTNAVNRQLNDRVSSCDVSQYYETSNWTLLESKMAKMEKLSNDTQHKVEYYTFGRTIVCSNIKYKTELVVLSGEQNSWRMKMCEFTVSYNIGMICTHKRLVLLPRRQVKKLILLPVLLSVQLLHVSPSVSSLVMGYENVASGSGPTSAAMSIPQSTPVLSSPSMIFGNTGMFDTLLGMLQAM